MNYKLKILYPNNAGYGVKSQKWLCDNSPEK